MPSLRTLAQNHSRSFAPIAVTSKAPENHTVTWASLLCLQWNPRDIGRWNSFKDSDRPAWQEPAWYSAPVRTPFLQHCQSHLKTAPRHMEFKTVHTGGWVWGDSMPWKKNVSTQHSWPQLAANRRKAEWGCPKTDMGKYRQWLYTPPKDCCWVKLHDGVWVCLCFAVVGYIYNCKALGFQHCTWTLDMGTKNEWTALTLHSLNWNSKNLFLGADVVTCGSILFLHFRTDREHWVHTWEFRRCKSEIGFLGHSMDSFRSRNYWPISLLLVHVINFDHTHTVVTYRDWYCCLRTS